MSGTKTKYAEARCRVCGCTDNDACEGGCSWVEEDLCSSCQVTKEQVGRVWYYTIPMVVDGHVLDLSLSRPQLLKIVKGENANIDDSVSIHTQVTYRGQVKK